MTQLSQDTRLENTLKAITVICGCYGYSEPKNGAIMARIASFVLKNFKSIDATQMIDAFELASLGKLEKVELNPVGQQINNSIIGSVLTGYKELKQKEKLRNPEIKETQIPKLDSGQIRMNNKRKCQRLIDYKNESDFKKVYTIDYEFINGYVHPFSVDEKLQAIDRVKSVVIEEINVMMYKDSLNIKAYKNRIRNIDTDHTVLNYAKKWLAWNWAKNNTLNFNELINKID